MSKTIKQAYGATIVVAKGKTVSAGTAISLPTTEANRLAEAFGIVDPVARSASERRSRDPDIVDLEEAVRDRADALARAAEAAEKEPSDDNVAAMERAQADLADAENALKAAS